MSFRHSRLIVAVALGLGYRPGAAQTVPAPTPRPAVGALPPASPASLAMTEAPEPTPPHASAALKRAYRVRLTSTWPQESAGDCRNGGEETIAGELTRQADGTYAGTLTRHTSLLFCGAHGPDAAACALTLAGAGPVAMSGVVLADDRALSGRALRVTWVPAPDQEVTVSGACAE